jgi:hypothetical protein
MAFRDWDEHDRAMPGCGSARKRGEEDFRPGGFPVRLEASKVPKGIASAGSSGARERLFQPGRSILRFSRKGIGTVMPKPGNVLAALGAVMLAACGARERAAADNGGVEAEAAAPSNAAAPADLKPSEAEVDRVVEPVHSTPPDAVSNPEGYLPPPPDPEPTGSNASSADKKPPATEDEHMRDKR